ncbi:glycoside hydrolase/deacetylase [Guyanagaster necrorhizus]|uniref:chitin deacetylase n=1 Tax=Guyanagaster necrorhizus TaxID=856835 RepID=A0A9P7VYD2_9AGAR|nr:glycoside hydrolase/deacetylase [Guyanagaster necrorhizus MCA 3950]KAG7449836.1 glycoside hydrolase/deacetylase [Guyanagaster necrorhizus MCA 3950]
MALGSLSLCAFLLLTFLTPGSLAADRTSEAGEAAISDPSQECTAYYYAPSATKISSFPTIWQPASIVANDSAAQAKWQSIMGSVPTNITAKGTSTGNFTNVTYSASDPDCWWSYHQCVTPKLAGLPDDIATVPEPNTLGFGFDDGPNCSHNAFYDYLTSQNQKATMFYIGSNVMDWPLEAQRAIADGHQICVHTWSHRYMTSFSSEDAFAELYYTIKLVTGVTPKCWRPPFGDVDDRIRAIANALGLQTVIWKYDSNDWKAGTGNITAATVDANYQALINNATSGTFSTQGTIMLTHELNNYTMSTAMKWYPQLKAAFQYLVPIAAALNITQPYVETNYSFPTFEQYISGNTTVNVTATSAPASKSNGGVALFSSGSLALLGVLTVLGMMP